MYELETMKGLSYLEHIDRKTLRLRLVRCKLNSECKMNAGENIFGKGKYFQVFGCIPKNALENIF